MRNAAVAAMLLAIMATVAATDPRVTASSAVELVAPANGSHTAFPFIHFEWVCAGANMYADYDVIVVDAASHAVVAQDRINGRACRFYPSDPLPEGSYVWQVTASSISAASGWSHVTVTAVDHELTIDVNATFTDVVAALRDAAALSGSKRVTFAPRADRTYRLNPMGASWDDYQALLNVTQAQDLLVDGGGQLLNFSWPVTFAYVTLSSRVALLNMQLDISPLPYTAFAILDVVPVSVTTGRVTVALLPGHPTVESNPAFTTSGIFGVQEPDLARDRRGLTEVFNYANLTRVACSAAAKAEETRRLLASNICYTVLVDAGWTTLSKADVIYLDPRQAPGFVFMGTTQPILYNTSIYACSNECITSQNSDYLAILRANMQLLPGRCTLLTIHVAWTVCIACFLHLFPRGGGGGNHHSMRIGPWISDGLFESPGDDTCHVSGLVMSVDRVINETTVALRPSVPDVFAAQVELGNLWLQVGDELSFYDHMTGRILLRAHIHALGTGGLVDGMPTTLAHLDQPVPTGAVPGIIGGNFNATVTQVFDTSRTAERLVFRRNVLHNGRRVGLLAKGRQALVEHNTAVGLGGGLVELFNAPYEGLCAHSYLVRNNTCLYTNQLDRVAAPIWVERLPNNAQLDQFCHDNLTVENNTFVVGPGPIFLLDAIANVTLRDNHLVRCTTDHSAYLQTGHDRSVQETGTTVSLTNDPALCVK
ncbi:uncharacterized protein MONBRDRAFT_11368 [Monosiga brevicollis MX1]|uniref:Right handed beta helix domain-containing protein n=1 Tax=Monosiga brevicollis TaxID=81824 RepID=A9V916_MONBE|nr:uncharacterized protein MONBRDRAFT_11368 [Monosiga brevicollis MX1]EDQ86051.1 predicted protein [Monosiga brevicollis MX1]|eukprot:XP_001749245.1 hypothetical protein [Monosiga brevicollis MX1]